MTDWKLNSIFVGLNVRTFREKYTSSLRACSCMCILSLLRENTNGGSRISQRGAPNPEIRQWTPKRNIVYFGGKFQLGGKFQIEFSLSNSHFENHLCEMSDTRAVAFQFRFT